MLTKYNRNFLDESFFDLFLGKEWRNLFYHGNEMNLFNDEFTCNSVKNEFKWYETNDKWYLNILSDDAEILVDDDTISIECKQAITIDDFGEKKIKKVFTTTYPDNSIHESIKAKKEDGKIVISLDKAIIEDNKKRRIEIE